MPSSGAAAAACSMTIQNGIGQGAREGAGLIQRSTRFVCKTVNGKDLITLHSRMGRVEVAEGFYKNKGQDCKQWRRRGLALLKILRTVWNSLKNLISNSKLGYVMNHCKIYIRVLSLLNRSVLILYHSNLD